MITLYLVPDFTFYVTLSSAKILVDSLEQQLRIVAPISGIVSRVNIQEEQAFGANATAVEILDPNIIELQGQIDQQLVVRTNLIPDQRAVVL